ncbi:MAG: hypothetical protein KatS3mg129_0358 [Leptospiraceae bacterium]|nr:MAG: hypothetical protein KatS3mg129_0358 [Leptospiraceae bacterium]
MVASVRNIKINPLELRGNDRVFQIDRDTILIYTGLHLEDFRPFSRIGAGHDFPVSIIQLVENVLLPERHMWNVGIEEMWLRNSIDSGISKLKYVGSKEMLNYLNRYFDLESYYSNGKKADKIHLPVEYKVYQPPNQRELNKDKSSIVYMHTGDFQVLVGGSRVMDSGNYFRARLTIDKEYLLLKRIIEKLPEQQAKNGFSFFVFDGELFSSLFNFNGELLAINPLPEMHFRLFEMQIDPDRINMAITSSPYLPGFVELFRRADVIEKEFAVSYPDVEKLTLLKRIYYYSRPKFFSDGSTLPYARYVNYYESKTKSHAVLAFRVRDDIENQLKILFPLLPDKINRNFDYIKGPFDIEFIKINDKKDLLDLQFSNFYFIIQGAIKDKKWYSLRLNENYLPAIPGAEYKIQQIIDIEEVLDFFQNTFENTVFGDLLYNLASKIASYQSVDDLLSIKDELYLIRTQAIPADKVLLYNLAEALKLLYNFTNYYQELPPDVNRLFLKVRKRFSHQKVKLEEIYNLSNSIKIHVFVKTGEFVSCFITEVEPLWNISIQYPPHPDSAIDSEKEYRRYLKEQHKLIDKGIGTQLERNVLEFLEKLLEERIYYNEQRQKLQILIDSLKPNLEEAASALLPREKKGVPFHMKLPYWLRITLETLRVPESINYIENKLSKFKK